MIITSNLNVKMAEYNYSIKDVHEKTKLSRTTISNLYNNYSDGIKIETLERLCDLFNCTPNDLLKITYINFDDITFEKVNTVYDLNEDRSFKENDKMVFYKANVQLTVDNIFHELEISLIVKNLNTHQDSDLNIGVLRLENDYNLFIANELNSTGLVKIPVSNKIEEFVLSEFIDKNISKQDFDLVDEIEYTFK